MSSDADTQESPQQWMVKQVYADLPSEVVDIALQEADHDPELAILMLMPRAGKATSDLLGKPIVTLSSGISGDLFGHHSPTHKSTSGLLHPPETHSARHRSRSFEHPKTVVKGWFAKEDDHNLRGHLRSSKAHLKKALLGIKEVDDQLKARVERRFSDTPSPSAMPPEMMAVGIEVAKRLSAAEVAPDDFFQMNSRLMIASKRRVAEVQRDQGLPEDVARIKVGKERLHDRLSCLGLREETMAMDGNCQFRTFAYYLYGDVEQHSVVRLNILQFMRKHPDLYSPYFDGDDEFKEYIARMSHDKEWGDEMTLKGCCDCYRVVIHLVMSTGTRWYHKITPEERWESEQQIATTYLSPIHYNAIVLGESKP